MKGFLLGLTKLILGIALALVLLSLVGVATARYLMAKLSVLPPKPIFDNDAISQTVEAAAPPVTPPAAAAPPTPAPTPAPEKPPGSYEALVVQPIGLVVRSGPGAEYEQMGGVDYNERILVLKTSDDGRWMNIRILDSGQEGWVKAGNTQGINQPAQ